jgi:uncharacterized protein (TIGR02145 family)
MKKLLTILFAVALGLNLSAQVPDYVPTEGLVGWWPLDGDAVDASAANEVGELNGVNEVENRFNEPNTALQFEGEVSFVNLGLENLLSLTEDDTLSIAFWNFAEGYGAPITKYQHDNYGSSWFVEYSPTFGCRIWGDGTSGTPSPADWSLQCPNDPSGWAHVVVVFNGGSGVLWLNGEFICESNFPVSSLSQVQPVLLGRSNCPTEENCNQFSGKLDDLGFWTRALTSDEILALYNAELPAPGCTDSTACNFDSEATSDDGSCIPSGCMESEACNYNALAECAGEACDYTCCLGPGCCLEGTTWDADLGGCIPTDSFCPEDLDGDGVIGVEDLMQLLSSFGTMCEDSDSETAEFTCSDPVNYHGYDYATVQIGVQCWFAENLRAELYENGDVIPGELSDNEWSSAMEGAQAIYNNDTADLADYGRLYNWYAVDDPRGLCPNDWHVPTDGELVDFENYIISQGFNDNLGASLKSIYGWSNGGNGTDNFGFSGLPGGFRSDADGYFFSATDEGYWWSSTGGWTRRLKFSDTLFFAYAHSFQDGFSVRCIKDTE